MTISLLLKENLNQIRKERVLGAVPHREFRNQQQYYISNINIPIIRFFLVPNTSASCFFVLFASSSLSLATQATFSQSQTLFQGFCHFSNTLFFFYLPVQCNVHRLLRLVGTGVTRRRVTTAAAKFRSTITKSGSHGSLNCPRITAVIALPDLRWCLPSATTTSSSNSG